MSDKPVILVVEDDDDCRSVLQDLLELNGYAVVTCPGGEKAVAQAKRSTPALVLVDYQMPQGDGAFVVQSLKDAGGALARVPVVLTSGSQEGREIAERLGVRALDKPFDVSRLLELVQSLVPA